MSLKSAQRYGEMMRKIREQEERQAYLKTPAGQAELARQQAEHAAQEARMRRLETPIPLVKRGDGIVFGTRLRTGEDVAVPIRRLRHMLISGVSGAGKSVFSHSLIWQLLQSSETDRLVLIDLKGGVEFERYRTSAKVEVVWDFPAVEKVVSGLMYAMGERQEYMRKSGLQHWDKGRTFVIIDEFAEIQGEIDAAETKDDKIIAKRLTANLISISRRARALGIVLICALQKATTDAMPSSLRNNLDYRIVFRCANRLTASSMLDDVDSLPVDPTQLPTGRFYFYDASRGEKRLLQSHIAPGVNLSDYW